MVCNLGCFLFFLLFSFFFSFFPPFLYSSLPPLPLSLNRAVFNMPVKRHRYTPQLSILLNYLSSLILPTDSVQRWGSYTARLACGVALRSLEVTEIIHLLIRKEQGDWGRRLLRNIVKCSFPPALTTLSAHPLSATVLGRCPYLTCETTFFSYLCPGMSAFASSLSHLQGLLSLFL